MANKKKTWLIIGGILLLLVPIGTGIWYLTKKPSGNPDPTKGTPEEKSNAERITSGRG